MPGGSYRNLDTILARLGQNAASHLHWGRMMRLAGLALVTALLALPGQALAADPLRAQQWNLDIVEADAAHATATGQGAVVAVIDSGVNASHPDLQGRLLPGYD